MGLVGQLEGLIFDDWTEIPDHAFPDAPCWGGLDFGYTNDPTASVKICKIGESIFIHEICYSPAIAPIQIKQLFEANGMKGRIVYCEHDPDMGAQLRNLGMNVTPARKGQGSIKAGIQKLKEYKVFYTASSKNLKIELSRYKWVKDDEGKQTNSAIDSWNHCIDAIRYGVYTHLFRG
jgi:phage terminase large subunit